MKKDQFKNASELTKQLLAVSHAEIKAKLDAEKQAKKRKKAKKSSALGREANGRT